MSGSFHYVMYYIRVLSFAYIEMLIFINIQLVEFPPKRIFLNVSGNFRRIKLPQSRCFSFGLLFLYHNMYYFAQFILHVYFNQALSPFLSSLRGFTRIRDHSQMIT